MISPALLDEEEEREKEDGLEMAVDDRFEESVENDDGSLELDEMKFSASSDAPIEERLKPDKPFHGELLAKLMARRDASSEHISQRAGQWKETNTRLRMYIDLTKSEKKADGTTNSNKKMHPFQNSVVVPASYSILHVLLMQLMSIFGTREPLIQVRGRSPDDIEPSKIMEAVLAYDLDQMGAYQTIYSACQDSCKFGCGIVYDYWNTEYGEKVVRQQPPPGPLGEIMMQLLGPAAFVERQWGVVKEHNQWNSVDPFNYYPDPRVPIGAPEQGEFVGHRFFRGHMHIVERSMDNGGPYFNVEDLEKFAGTSSRESSTSNVATETFGDGAVDMLDRGIYELDHLQIKLIPHEWELGPETRPEIWWFTWANDGVIIRAHKSPYEHGKFGYSVAESDPDFHSAFNPGIIESIDGLQRYMDWMFNSHLQNLMRHLNDAMIFSPALIDAGDVTHPGPGRHIRMTPLGEELLMSGGYSINQFIHQLPVQDVTTPHLNAMNQMFQLAQRMSAANDNQMGMPTPDRHTLGEIQGMNASAASRIGTVAQIIDSMCITPLSNRAIANRLQFTELEQYFRVVGEDAHKGAEFLLAGRDTIQGNFDYVPISGTTPPDPVRQARTWSQVLETLTRLQGVMQPTEDGKIPDINKVAMELFKSMGVKNIGEFFTTPPPPPPEVMPDEAVEQGVQDGNMIPMDPSQQAMMDPAMMAQMMGGG